MTERNLPPRKKRRNRILALILALIIIAIMLLTFRGMYHADFDEEKLRHYQNETETGID